MPLNGADWQLPIAIVCLAYTALGITGFGSALIAVPLLAWHWPLVEVVPVVVTLDVLASLLHGSLNRRWIQWQVLVRLVPGIVLGVALGTLVSRVVDSKLPLLVLGLFVIWVGANALRRKTAAHAMAAAGPSRPWLSGLVGLVTGMIEAMFGTSGPPVVAWLTRQFDDARLVRASTPVALAFAGVIALAGFGVDGRLGGNSYTTRLAVLAGPAMLCLVGGHLVAGRLNAGRLRMAICLLLVASGLSLVHKALGP
jgi:uncharacterized membrane protein YfcA